MFLIRKKLSATEGSPPDTRYNPDTDTVETSPDGGLTWNEDPASDPRSNPAFLLPLPVDPDRCAAAAGVETAIRDFVNAVGFGAELVSVANAIMLLGVIFIPISWMWALALGIAALLIDIGFDELQAEFTESVYEKIRCAFYDTADAEGRWDDTAIADTLAALAIDPGGLIVPAVVGFATQMLGSVGISNAGIKNADPEADCTCGWRAEFPVDSAAGVWALFGTSGGEYTSGFHVTTVFVSGNPARPRRQVYISTAFDSADITRIEMHFTATYGVLVSGFATNGMFTNSFGTVIQYVSTADTSPYVWDGLLTLDDLGLVLGTGASDSGGSPLGDGTITSIAIEGLDPAPSQFTPYLV